MDRNSTVPIGKRLEHFVRHLRPHLNPHYRKAYSSLLARGMGEQLNGETIVCCDFSNPAIDSVGGRYYFSIVRDLIDAGYFPVFTARRATLSTFGTSAMKSPLLTERLGVVRSLDELTQPYFLITDGDAPAPPNTLGVIRMSYERRRSQGKNELEFPVFVHPWLTTKIKFPYIYDLNAIRPVRLFFGGNTEEGKYDKDILRDLYSMLTRREMLTVTRAEFTEAEIHRPRDASRWLPSRDVQRFVLCETQHCKIPQERWLDALAKSDFFLACPGVGMPLCHNLIEALAAGCIPILQYANYLPNSLEDRVNCLTFNNNEELKIAIRLAQSMSSHEIRILRKNVKQYYDDFLAPGRFTQRMFNGETNQITLLMNAYRVPRSSSRTW
jgi:hypothetical protein